MLRVISEVRPRWVVAENVRGLLSIESGSVFAEVITSLESEGYEVITFCVPASAVEAPHRRDRLWIVAHTDRFGERAGHREVQETDGEISERYDDAESGDTDLYVAADPRLQSRTLREQSNARESAMPARDNRRDVAADPGRKYGSRNVEGLEACQTERTSGDIHLERCDKDGTNKNGGHGKWDEHWTEVATRLCRVDDGLSVRMDEFELTATGHRVGRLKSLGNSIVPQIAFEIFKAIQEADDRQPTSL